MRVGLGFDVHPFTDDPARALVLGGVTIDGPGLEGHSDADVVAHAVADAVLGAAGLPDIGTLFPAGDERYRGADSMRLLIEVAAQVAAAGWKVVNVDVVVVAEQPRLAPHLEAMGANLSAAFNRGSPPGPEGSGAVTVKPKRGEGLGAIGRAEGIAAMAVALVEGIGQGIAPDAR
jgi:2-C-methyl-D-erythritol 2,4-cyclodiphosphate synthase